MNSRPFDDWIDPHDLNTGLVSYSDRLLNGWSLPSCNYKRVKKSILSKTGIVAERSRALVRNHLEWMVPSSNPGKGRYGNGELSVTRTDSCIVSN